MFLEIKNASFSYKKDRPIIKDLNFSASSGDLIAILGPNGAGKTTMLRCIMGFLKFNKGKSTLDGSDIYTMSSKYFWSKVSYVPQAKGNSSSFTAEDMILLGMTSKIGVFSAPTENDRKKVYNTAKALGIDYLLNKKCNQMSGGELQMVLIARALISDPELLILDEPESNLDFRNQLIVLDTLSKLASHGMCVIFNTHFPEHALTRANKALILHKGGKVLFGKTQEIVTEKAIKEAFGVKTLISEVESAGNTYKSIMPIKLENEETYKEATNDLRKAIAVISVIFSQYSLSSRVNEIFSKYGGYIIGRMGMPYNKEVYIINVTVDAPVREIESMRHELSILPGVNVKATVSER